MSDNKQTTSTNEGENPIEPTVFTTEYVDKADAQKPNTKSETKKPQDVGNGNNGIVINIAEKKDKAAMYIGIAGLVVSAIVGWFTIKLFRETKTANTIAADANKRTDSAIIEARRANDIAERNIILAEESSIFQDSISAINMNLAQQSLQSQDNAIKETKKEFESESRAFLSAANITIDTNVLNKPFTVSFTMLDMGKFPANIFYSKLGMAISGVDKTYEFVKQIMDRDNSWIVRELSEIISNSTNITYDVPSHRALTPAELEFFKKGKASIYLSGEFKYKSFGVNKKYSMNFTIRITRNPIINKLNFESIKFTDTEIK